MNKIIFGTIIVGMLLAAFVFNLSSFPINPDNAVKECPLHNVHCPRVLQPIGAEPEVLVVRGKIGDYCSRGDVLGCYSRMHNKIYLYREDKGVVAHERCHWLCGRLHVDNTLGEE